MLINSLTVSRKRRNKSILRPKDMWVWGKEPDRVHSLVISKLSHRYLKMSKSTTMTKNINNFHNKITFRHNISKNNFNHTNLVRYKMILCQLFKKISYNNNRYNSNNNNNSNNSSSNSNSIIKNAKTIIKLHSLCTINSRTNSNNNLLWVSNKCLDIWL